MSEQEVSFPEKFARDMKILEGMSSSPVVRNDPVIPTLPPVSPEDLVEGEWYVVKKEYTRSTSVFQCRDYGLVGFGFDLGDRVITMALGMAGHEIYGPLKFKIGGAE